MIVRRVCIALAVLAIGSGTAFALRREEPACPSGTWRDPEREERIAQRLIVVLEKLRANHESARTLLSRSGEEEWCFGRQDEVHEGARVVVLADSLRDDEAAARAVHLLHHLHVTPVWTEEPVACDVKVRRALSSEREAVAMEREARAASGLPAQPEPDFTALAKSYGQRCQREQR